MRELRAFLKLKNPKHVVYISDDGHMNMLFNGIHITAVSCSIVLKNQTDKINLGEPYRIAIENTRRGSILHVLFRIPHSDIACPARIMLI